ncbi:MAG: CPBP family glutamic-type intramembrane protease [Prochloraceae cyanobacterium]
MSGKWFKRLILFLLTLFAIARVFFSLGESLNQPQIQTRLELYQTNLILHAAEFKPEELDGYEEDTAPQFSTSLQALIGENPYSTAQKQYQKALDTTQTYLTNLETQLKQSELSEQPEQLQGAIQQEEQFIDELNLKLGILQAQQGNTETALETWEQLINKDRQQLRQTDISKTAKVLQDLWSKSPNLSSELDLTTLTAIENGWFHYRVLKQLDTVQERQDDLLILQEKEQNIAAQAILKLALIGGIPLLLGFSGGILLTFLLIQWWIKKDQAILATNSNLAWETPWDGETVWQVIIVGFFFISQILLPILIGISGFNAAGLSLRFKALYVLVTYLIMSAGGLSVLYFSIKSFFPLPQDWFRFQWLSNWIVWGIGGYVVALPLVVVVSLINQQFWQGQGGSNPLLFLALQAQDKVALAIFFFTASVAAPVFEEIIFRGFLLSSLTRYLSVWGAIFASSFLFAIAHLSLSEVLPLTTLGIVLGVVYTRSRNLLAPMLIHSLWNSGTLFSLFVLGSSAG